MSLGDIKGNFGVRRFLLRGLEKVKIEWGRSLHRAQYEENGGSQGMIFPFSPTNLLKIIFQQKISPIFSDERVFLLR